MDTDPQLSLIHIYVSYYDTNIGIHNILYTGVEAPDNYGHIYQSDLCGWVGQLGYNKESAYFANVYEAAGREDLEAVGFYATGQDTRYQVYVSQNVGDPADLSDRTLVAEGSFENAGFYTVRLEEPVELAAGSRFAVIVKTVSYTHLDVYKRQVFTWSTRRSSSTRARPTTASVPRSV